MRTTGHSSIKEIPFERHYGRKPRTEIHNYLNMSPNKHYNVSARPETLQANTFTNGNGALDQLVMKAPRKLKEDVSNKFPYLFLKKKQNKEKFESAYENKPQTAVAGTKHTIITDKNKIIHRKRISKPLNPIFQNPLSRRGENPRGKDGRFLQQGQLNEDIEEPDVTAEHSERCSTPVLEENILDKTLEMEDTTISPVYGRGRRKLIRDRNQNITPTPGLEINARPITEDDPNVITVVDQNGNNNNLIKTENIEQTENQNKQSVRKSTRIRSANPIIRYGNPITF